MLHYTYTGGSEGFDPDVPGVGSAGPGAVAGVVWVTLSTPSVERQHVSDKSIDNQWKYSQTEFPIFTKLGFYVHTVFTINTRWSKYVPQTSSTDGRSSGQYQMTASATIYSGISGSCASTYCFNVYYYRKCFDL